MASDLRPYGAGDGLGYYWVKSFQQFGNHSLELTAIDEVGNINATGAHRDFEAAGYTKEEAVLEHLEAGIKQADASLERRRRAKASEPESEPKPPPLSPEAQRFLEDAD